MSEMAVALSFERFMVSTLKGRSEEVARMALWNWFIAPQRGHLMTRRVYSPSPSLREHAPHRISFIASQLYGL